MFLRRSHVALVVALLSTVAPRMARADAPAASGAPARGVLTRPPELVQFAEAVHPESEAGRTASVTLQVTIRDDGTVEDATVTESAGPAFDAAAVDAVRRFVFSPAEIDGRPSRIRILYRYDFVQRVEAPTTAIFTGVVRDREARAPLPGVTVTLGDGRSVVTDAEGRFELRDVAPGAQTVTLEGERLTALQTEETFVAGERLDATYDVFLNSPDEEGDDMEIVVAAPALRRQAVSTEVGAEEARRVPGTTGDVLRVVETMPGVARSTFGSGALIVWGAAPGDTGVYVDGVRVPRLYHDSGLRSVVGSEFVRSVELVPGGYGAAYSRGLGGLVTVRTNRFDERDGIHGAASADLYDAAANVNGRIGDRVNFGVGGRYGYVGPLLQQFYPQIEEYFPIPHYYDAQARVGVRLRSNETLDLTGLISHDYTRRTAPNTDPTRLAFEDRKLDFQRVYLRYARDLGDGTTVNAVLFGGADQSSQVYQFGVTNTRIEQNVATFGLRASYRTRVSSFLVVEGGLDSVVDRTDVVRIGSIAAPPREGDIRTFGQPLPDQVSSDRFTVTNVNVAPYAEADFGMLQDRLHVTAGLRIDPYARSVSRSAPQVGQSPTHGLFLQDFRIEPRAAIRFAPTPTTFLTAAFGLYGQPAQPSDLSASFGNPTLPAAWALHYVLGGGWKPMEKLAIEVTAFATTSEDIAMRNPTDQPRVAEALLPTGQQRTYGVQTLLRLDPIEHFYGWVSYTLARAERLDAPGMSWRPSDYDQRHVLTALAGYELPHGFEVGLRLRVATGFPRTTVTGAYYDDRVDLYQPRFGTHNALRLPTFFQADLRAAKKFDIADTKLEVYLEIQNFTNRQNTEEFLYNANYTQRGGIHGLPILPVLGLRWSF